MQDAVPVLRSLQFLWGDKTRAQTSEYNAFDVKTKKKWPNVQWEFRGERNVFLPTSLRLKLHLELKYMPFRTAGTFLHTEILI